MKDSPFEQRAWTLQERLLTRRVLFVTNSEVSLYCRERFYTELNWQINGEDLTESLSNPLDLPVSPNDQHDLDGLNAIQHEGIEKTTPRTRCLMCFDLVRIYAQRKLTYQSDILTAFSGIQAVLAEAIYHTSFSAGLPDLAIGIALH